MTTRHPTLDTLSVVLAGAALAASLLLGAHDAAQAHKPGAFSGRAEIAQYSPGTNRPRVDLRRIRCRWNGTRTTCTRSR